MVSIQRRRCEPASQSAPSDTDDAGASNFLISMRDPPNIRFIANQTELRIRSPSCTEQAPSDDPSMDFRWPFKDTIAPQAMRHQIKWQLARKPHSAECLHRTIDDFIGLLDRETLNH